MEKFQEILSSIYELIVTYGMKFILAIVVLIVGLLVFKWLTKALVRVMKRGHENDSLIPFLKTLTNILLKVMNNQLRAITNFGLLLGAIIGVVMPFLNLWLMGLSSR